VDDIVSAALNYADGLLEVDATGAYRALVVRRKRPEREGPDDVQAGVYRAEIVPLRFNVTRERDGGPEVCFLDLTRFSSWATPSNPARITFGRDRRPESIEVALILGTRVKITFHEPW
jgi:hypothetical protein